jgi:glycine cleavage system aminomethyltransferase T
MADRQAEDTPRTDAEHIANTPARVAAVASATVSESLRAAVAAATIAGEYALARQLLDLLESNVGGAQSRSHEGG